MTIIVVLDSFTYNNLECMIFSIMKLSVSTQGIKIQYRVKNNISLMEILHNISLSFYLEPKREDKYFVNFSLCMDITTVSKSHKIEYVDNVQCLKATNFEENDMTQL